MQFANIWSTEGSVGLNQNVFGPNHGAIPAGAGGRTSAPMSLSQMRMRAAGAGDAPYKVHGVVTTPMQHAFSPYEFNGGHVICLRSFTATTQPQSCVPLLFAASSEI